MARRQHLSLALGVALFFFFSLSYLLTSGPSSTARTAAKWASDAARGATSPSSKSPPGFEVDLDGAGGLLHGGSIAPKLENATLK